MRKRNAVRAAAAALAAMMHLRHAAVAAEMKRPQQPEEILAPQQPAEMRQFPAPARLERQDITVAMGADIVTLDPAGQQDTTTAVVIKHAYSTLLDISDEGELVPDLAESYELVNDTDFVFKLREDAVWSDGLR